MAILKSLIVRGGRKQIGGMVLYSRKGETIARELAAQVSNPRTEAQMEQRVKLANLVAFYRANKAWMRGAFENKKERESDYNAFVSENMASTLVATSKSEVNSGAAVVAPYKISSGSLPIIETTLNGIDLTTNIFLGTLTIDSETTIGEFSQAVIDNNAGIVQGMQLSLIINLQLSAAGTGIPYIVVRAYEVLIDPTNPNPLTDAVPEGLLESVGTGSKALGLLTTDLGEGAAAFILSHTIGSGTRVSTQSLVFFSSNPTYRAYTSDAAWARAIASYGEGSINFLDSKTASSAQYVETTLALLGIAIEGDELQNNDSYEAETLASSIVQFNFNKALPANATISGYWKSANSQTRHNLTNIEEATNRRYFQGTIPSGEAPSSDGTYSFVAVVNGDEYPTNVRISIDANQN